MRTDWDWIRNEANFGRIRIGLDFNFFENWRIKTRTEINFVVAKDFNKEVAYVAVPFYRRRTAHV